MGQPLRRTGPITDPRLYVAVSSGARANAIVRAARLKALLQRPAAPADPAATAVRMAVLKECGISAALEAGRRCRIPVPPDWELRTVTKITDDGMLILKGFDDPVSPKTAKTWLARKKEKSVKKRKG